MPKLSLYIISVGDTPLDGSICGMTMSWTVKWYLLIQQVCTIATEKHVCNIASLTSG